MRLPRIRRRTLTTLAVVAVIALIALNVARQSFLGWSIDQQAAQLEAVLKDPNASQGARDAAVKRSAETSQAYSEWMTRRSEEFQKKYVPEMERLTKVAQDPESTDAQRDEASRQRPVIIRCDARCEYQQFIQVKNVLKLAGIETIFEEVEVRHDNRKP